MPHLSPCLSFLLMRAMQNIKQVCILFHCWFLGRSSELKTNRERQSCGLVGWWLLGGEKEGRKACFGQGVGWFLLSYQAEAAHSVGFMERRFPHQPWHGIVEVKPT